MKHQLSPAERNQIKVAVDTLKMSDQAVAIFSSITKEEAREILKEYGFNDKGIKIIKSEK